MMLIRKGVCLKEPKRTIPATQLHWAIKTGVICFIAQKRALPMARNVVGKRDCTEKCKKLGGLSVRLHGARPRTHCAKTKKRVSSELETLNKSGDDIANEQCLRRRNIYVPKGVGALHRTHYPKQKKGLSLLKESP